MATYEGPIYLRPLGRGIVVGAPDDMKAPHFEDWVEAALGVAGRVPAGGLTVRVRLVLEMVEGGEAQQ